VADRDKAMAPSALWWTALIGGIVAVILGLLVVFNPFDSVRFLTVIVGVALAVGGIFGIVASIRGTSRVSVAGPIIAVIGGLVLIFLPEQSVKTAAIIIGIVLLAFGIVTLIAAIVASKEVGWGPVVGGVVLAILGLVVVVWPGPTLSLIAILVGIAVLVSGLSMIVQAFRLRGSRH
jgi:uncharacterized membrane protein HdeD (DUF308 family)